MPVIEQAEVGAGGDAKTGMLVKITKTNNNMTDCFIVILFICELLKILLRPL